MRQGDASRSPWYAIRNDGETKGMVVNPGSWWHTRISDAIRVAENYELATFGNDLVIKEDSND